MANEPVGRVTTVMHDTADLDGAVRFWTKVLDLDVEYRDAHYCYLSGLAEGGPHLAFQAVPEPKQGKNRLHLDVRVPDRRVFAEYVVSLGGRLVAEHDEPGFPVWMVMADPQENEFCVYEKPEDAA